MDALIAGLWKLVDEWEAQARDGMREDAALHTAACDLRELLAENSFTREG